MKKLFRFFSIPLVALLISACATETSKEKETTIAEKQPQNVTEQWNSFVDSIWCDATFKQGEGFIKEKITLDMSAFENNYFAVTGELIGFDSTSVTIGIKTKKDYVMMNPIEHFIAVVATQNSEITNQLELGSSITVTGTYDKTVCMIKDGYKVITYIVDSEIIEPK